MFRPAISVITTFTAAHLEALGSLDGVVREKAQLVNQAFASQQGKHWFEEDLFLGLMRIRGMEASSASGYAEAFTCRKLSLLLSEA